MEAFTTQEEIIEQIRDRQMQITCCPKKRKENIRPKAKIMNRNEKGYYMTEETYKIVIIGDSGAGKTCLLLKFADGTYKNEVHATIGIDFKQKVLKLLETPVKLKIWDTAGQERFKSLSPTYLRNSDGCIAVYDITNRDSFLNLEE